MTVTNRGGETHELVIVRADDTASLPTKFATPDAVIVDVLARLPFDATVAKTNVAGAMQDGMLAFSAAAGRGLLVVHARSRAGRSSSGGVGSMARLSDDALAAWAADSCKRSGVPERLTDPAVVARWRC